MSLTQRTIATSRFGYGPRPGQTSPRDAGDLMAQLAPGAAYAPKLGGATIENRLRLLHEIRKLNRGNENNRNRDAIRAKRQALARMFHQDVNRRVMVAVNAPYGFFERLAWFWSDHFAASAGGGPTRATIGRMEVDAIRPHIGGYFRDMLAAASLHPAMIQFLNQNTSVGPMSKFGLKKQKGLNENLAREIIELHTLGVGADYSQTDIRQFAELLTGIKFNFKTYELDFTPNRAEPGPETVLGRTYGDGETGMDAIHAALDDLADHPATARHIARKLAVHFIADDPDEGLVAHMTAAFTQSGGYLPAVYEAMLEHPAAWRGFGAKVRQPFDFAVAAIRAADPNRRELDAIALRNKNGRRLFKVFEDLGQPVFRPPGPQGWEEDAAQWITARGLTARLNFASRIGRVMEPRLDPRVLLETALGERAREATIFAATKAAERWEGLAFVFASPEFNRR